MLGASKFGINNLPVRDFIVVVRCHNVKNGKEAIEVTEGKSSKMRLER